MTQVATQNRGEWPAYASLPPTYALELLTIFAWEQGGGEHRFHIAEGLRTVLGLIQQHQQLRVFWTVNYNFEDPALRRHLLGQLQKPRCTHNLPPCPASSFSPTVILESLYPRGVHGEVWVLQTSASILTLLPSGLCSGSVGTVSPRGSQGLLY